MGIGTSGLEIICCCSWPKPCCRWVYLVESCANKLDLSMLEWLGAVEVSPSYVWDNRLRCWWHARKDVHPVLTALKQEQPGP